MLQPFIASLAVRVLFWASLCAVIVLSLMPVDQLPTQVTRVWDKAQHAAGFAGLAWLGLCAYPNRSWAVVVGLLAVGAGIEWAQSLTGWRLGDVRDLGADAFGVLVGLILWRAGTGYIDKPSTP